MPAPTAANPEKNADFVQAKVGQNGTLFGNFSKTLFFWKSQNFDFSEIAKF